MTQERIAELRYWTTFDCNLSEVTKDDFNELCDEVETLQAEIARLKEENARLAELAYWYAP